MMEATNRMRDGSQPAVPYSLASLLRCRLRQASLQRPTYMLLRACALIFGCCYYVWFIHRVRVEVVC
jgi:hypothetical protein